MKDIIGRRGKGKKRASTGMVNYDKSSEKKDPA